MDIISKTMNKVLDWAENECEAETFSLVPVECNEVEAMRCVVRLRKLKQFKSVSYEKDDENIYIKVIYLNKKNMIYSKKRRK